MSRLGNFGARLHSGDVSYEFIARKRIWFIFSAVVIAISVASLSARGLNFGVEFSGGSIFQFTAPNVTQSEITRTVERTGVHEVVVQSVSGGRWRVQTPSLTGEQVTEVQTAIAKDAGIQRNDVSQEQIGPTWGVQVSKKAGLGLGIFLAACVVFLSVVFEWKMALSAILALLHDLIITAGVYSLVGFEVTPATVIGFLTILGYSLYDTVVVFDKVRDNTTGILGGSRHTFSSAANLAINQTLARSINTSIAALLPVAAILFVGTAVLGAGTLEDLSLALLVGIAAGAYSSVFIATPILTMLKEREPQMAALRRRVAARRSAAEGGAAEKPAGRSRRRSGARAEAAGTAKSTGGGTVTEAPPEDDADERDEDRSDRQQREPTTAAGDNGAAKPKVTVTGVPGGGSSGSRSSGSGGARSSGGGNPAQRPAKRGGGRPQPRRSGSKRKSKGKKKR